MTKTTREQREAIVAAYAAGVPSKVAAGRYGVSDSYVRTLARKAGLPKRGERPGLSLTPAQRREVVAAYATGETLAAVAARFRIVPEYVRVLAKRAGYPPRQIQNHRPKGKRWRDPRVRGAV